jgi:hypothetical protein
LFALRTTLKLGWLALLRDFPDCFARLPINDDGEVGQ